MDVIRNCLILIPGLPLAAAVFVAVLGPRVLRSYSHWPVVLAIVASFVCSLILVGEVVEGQRTSTAGGYEELVTLWTWAEVADAYRLPAASDAGRAAEGALRHLRIDVTLRADALTAMMLAMVTFVSALVAVYSAGYMAGDRGYWRFFAYIGLFVFSMTALVSVSNFVLLYVFWEAVGVCSYLLIGYWYEKPEAAAAGKKAFLVNRVGDFAFALALFLIWATYGTLNYHDTTAQGALLTAAALPDGGLDPPLVCGVLSPSRIQANDYVFGGVATAICLLLMLGACGKSAQFPLHVWLPDAMEGPTPVSALIHAATMVTAGVYMVARCAPLFMASPAAGLVVAGIGGFTALLAALIALTQFDLKRILAYSTISQLGYMFLALGAGTFAGMTAGLYHLFTHAFFKALLFLAAGSVMHAMGGVIDIRQLGGLKRQLPYTYWTFLIGCLALAGIFPLAGFWSKDAILAALHDKAHPLDHGAPGHAAYQWLYYGAVLTAFLTAFYTFRAFALTFHGRKRLSHQAGHPAHESPPVMVVPLVALAACSVLAGMVLTDLAGNWGACALVEFIGHTPSLAGGAVAATRGEPEFHSEVAGLSLLVALAGMGLALYFYMGEPSEARFLKRIFDLEGIDRLTDPQWVMQLERVWWIGGTARLLRQVGLGWLVTLAGYLLGLLALILAFPLVIAQFLTPYRLSHDKFYFDELYAAVIVWPLRMTAAFFAWMDRWIVDGLVDAIGRIPPAVGTLMRPLQMGLVQFYALAMVLGMLILVAARLIWA